MEGCPGIKNGQDRVEIPNTRDYKIVNFFLKKKQYEATENFKGIVG